MLRLILSLALCLALAGTARAATLPAAPPLHPAADFTPAGPAQAQGVLVWLHGAYNTDDPPPPLPDFLRRLPRLGWDVWRFDRSTGRDPLDAGGAALASGLAALRRAGYRHIAVAGHSRGAWIALTTLAHPGLADTVAAFSPAAFGAHPEQRERAQAAWHSLLDAAQPGDARVLLATWRQDPLIPDPDGLLASVRGAFAPDGFTLDIIDRPAAPTGHMAVYDPGFDKLFGACTARFLTGGPGC